MTDRQINKPITSNLIWFSPDYNLFHTQAVSDRNSFIFQWFCSNDRGWLRFIAFYGFIGGRQMDACINIIKKNVAHLSELREHQNKSENKLRGRVATTKIRNEIEIKWWIGWTRKYQIDILYRPFHAIKLWG